VTVLGDNVRVQGAGFLAKSSVDVAIGDLRAVVTADDVGAVDVLLSGTGEPATAEATGLSPSGTSTTIRPPVTATPTSSGPTLVGATLGAAPSLVLLRKKRSRVA
jgi:hypothetical protein